MQRRIANGAGVIQMIPYDELETKASYMVTGYDVPLYLRSKRRGGPFLFTETLDGSMGRTISIDSDAKILSRSGGPVVSGPSWFRVSSNRKKDIDALVEMIFTKYKRVKDDDFRTTCDEIKMGGIERAYDAGMEKYVTLLDFVKKSVDLTDWENDGKSLGDLFVGQDFLPKFLNTLGPLTERGRGYFLEEVKPEGRTIYELGIKQYDKAFAWEGELWTDGMGPCITIGLTGTFEGKRYNAMLHSQHPKARGPLLLEALQNPFGKGGLPPLHKLKDVRYFAMGGSPDSEEKATSILETFYKENLPVLGVTLTTDQASKDLAKSVHVTARGEVYFSQYDPSKEL